MRPLRKIEKKREARNRRPKGAQHRIYSIFYILALYNKKVCSLQFAVLHPDHTLRYQPRIPCETGAQTGQHIRSSAQELLILHFYDRYKFYIVFSKENDSKNRDFRENFFSKNRWILTFSLQGVLDLAQLLLLRPKVGEKMRKIRPKNSSQNRTNRTSRNFQKNFLYLFLPQTNHFRYRNARSHRPVLETEGNIKKCIHTEENKPTKVAKKKSWILSFSSLVLLFFLRAKHEKISEMDDSLAAPIETRMLDFWFVPLGPKATTHATSSAKLKQNSTFSACIFET